MAYISLGPSTIPYTWIYSNKPGSEKKELVSFILTVQREVIKTPESLLYYVTLMPCNMAVGKRPC